MDDFNNGIIPKRKFGRDVLHRWEGNPLIKLDDLPFRANTVFNGSPIKFGDEYLLLFRVEGQQGYSFFALARGNDGYHFNVEDEPVMMPVRVGPFAKYEEKGIEDPRITYIEGTYYILYTAVSKYGFRIALAKTKNFKDYKRIAFISEPGNKDGVLFPEKIDNRYVRLDRPLGKDIGSIWISYSDDLIHWGYSKVLLTPRHSTWESYRIGASAPPLKTEKGWLEIYHGVKKTSSGPIYRIGCALLDLEDPSKVISRLDVPILSPREYYERIGDINNVVFAGGAILEPNKELKIYYGAADTCLCVATVNIEKILERM